ncbi:MAG: ATP-binding cassette domain-containing protein [Bacteroidales bacterium]|nr:ATP-binding cassette domain-containing protein [Bacteroidales bacterium]
MQSVKENILLVDSVHLEFGQNQVLQSAYLTARTGRVTGVFGRNGTGKSCLFKCIMGGIRPQNMFIRFNDEPDTDYAHIGNRVKYLPQNLFMPSRMTLDEAFSLYGVDYEGLVGFEAKFHRYQHKTFKELSGGEARIAEMYLVLMSDAEFCILDEPFSNIAPNCIEKMQYLIREQKQSKGIIVSDHMYEDILEVTDDLFLLRDGYTFPIKSRDDLIRNGYILR